MPDELRDPGRRRFLQATGIAAGVIAGGGLAALGRAPHAEWDFRRTARALFDDLSPAQRKAICFDWDHPARQLLNHVACIDVPRSAEVLTPGQRRLVRRLYETMTSDEHRRRFGRLVGLEGGGLDPCEFVLFGDPRAERCQAVLSGGHLLIRGGGITDTGSAFGGPLAYGHQISNGVPGLPGNAFAYHGDALNALLANLSAEERNRSLVAGDHPQETIVQLLGKGAHFPGLAVRGLDDARKQEVKSLVDTVLSCHGESDQADAWGCIERNGGVDALHLAVFSDRGYYDDGAAWSELRGEERARRGDPYWHVWRVEGPGTVLYFRGWPHVHASIHVADDGGAGQNVGEVLAETKHLVEGDALRGLVLDAFREASGEPLGYTGSSLEARFCPGSITTGLVWSLDPYADELVIAEIRGRAQSEALRTFLQEQGTEIDDDRTYRIATSGFLARVDFGVGEAERIEKTGLRLRQVFESYFRKHGLSRLA